MTVLLMSYVQSKKRKNPPTCLVLRIVSLTFLSRHEFILKIQNVEKVGSSIYTTEKLLQMKCVYCMYTYIYELQ